MDILGLAPDGGEDRCPLWARLPDPPWGKSGLSPVTQNFIVVVNTVVNNWVTIVGDPQEGTGQEGLGTTIQFLSALFYAGDGFITSPERTRLQGDFDALTGLFYRVGLCTTRERN